MIVKHEVEWDVPTLQKFIKYGNLTKEQQEFMRWRTSDNTVKQTYLSLGISKTTYNRKLNELKEIYDTIQKEHPDELTKRKYIKEKQFRINSKEELISFAENTNFDRYYIRMEFIQKKSSN